MMHSEEDLRRGVKAYKLCLAFEALCKAYKPRMKKSVMLENAQRMERPFWLELARRSNLHQPSQATVDTAIGILAARAQVNL